jgi:SAM-dependent methyltransferase
METHPTRKVTMPKEDTQRWNVRYTQSAPATVAPRSILTQNQARLTGGGLALDVAMGAGANAAFLIEQGWQVVGVDRSDVAVFQAKTREPRIQAVIADTVHFWFPPQKFDLILNLYYLDRQLWPIYKTALKPRGLLIVETLTLDMLAMRPDLPPDFLLQPGELRQAFHDWDILFYREGWIASDHGTQKAVASLIARRT